MRKVEPTFPVYVPYPRFGVSVAADGKEVLTPFAGFGCCYPYSERIRRRFGCVTTVYRWAIAAFSVAAFVWGQAYHISASNFLADFILLLILADAARVPLTLMMFRTLTRLKMRSSTQVFASVPPPWAIRFIIFCAAFLETAILVGVLLQLPEMATKPVRFSMVVLVCHGAIYALTFLRARYLWRPLPASR
jgi:hypothetical protein